eukprot:242546_1
MSTTVSISTTPSTSPMERTDSNKSTDQHANLNKIHIRDQHLVNGYLREQQDKLFHRKSSQNNYYTLHSINIVILMYWCAGIEIIDRYGFLIEHMLPEQQHRKRIQKENQRLLKWQAMIFPKKKGGASAEADNELDQQIFHWNSVKDHRKLKPRIRKGIPNQLRGTIWQNLCGARERAKIECARYGSKTLFTDLKRRRSTLVDHDQIWKDINRTYRENIAFGGVNANPTNNNLKKPKNGTHKIKRAQSKFFKYTIHDGSDDFNYKNLEQQATPTQTAVYNVLKAFALHRKDVGYCQGMQSVVALLIMYMTEEEAFWVLAS